MQKSDQKINNIQVRIDPFVSSDGSKDDQTTLDDILLHSDYALNAFYKGQLDIELSRGTMTRKVHVKTTLNKAIMFIKVFPYTESQTYFVVSPRKILMRSRLQMEKVFYSDHYYVEIFWDFDEQLDEATGEISTTLSLSCELVFVKSVALVKGKIQSYYNENLITSFEQHLRPQLERWIESEVIEPRRRAAVDMEKIEAVASQAEEIREEEQEEEKRGMEIIEDRS